MSANPVFDGWLAALPASIFDPDAVCDGCGAKAVAFADLGSLIPLALCGRCLPVFLGTGDIPLASSRAGVA